MFYFNYKGVQIIHSPKPQVKTTDKGLTLQKFLLTIVNLSTIPKIVKVVMPLFWLLKSYLLNLIE